MDCILIMKNLLFALLLLPFFSHGQSCSNPSEAGRQFPALGFVTNSGDTICWYWNEAETKAYIATHGGGTFVYPYGIVFAGADLKPTQDSNYLYIPGVGIYWRTNATEVIYDGNYWNVQDSNTSLYIYSSEYFSLLGFTGNNSGIYIDNAGNTSIGDVYQNGSSTYVNVNDESESISAGDANYQFLSLNANSSYIGSQSASAGMWLNYQQTKIGDYNINNNGTCIINDDASEMITAYVAGQGIQTTIIDPAGNFTPQSNVRMNNGGLFLEQDYTTDADFNIYSNWYMYELKTSITAGRNIIISSPTSNGNPEIRIWNRNTSGFSWAFQSTVVDVTGTQITTIANNTLYCIYWDGTQWIKIN